MAFEWRRLHKYEENFEHEIREIVKEQVLSHYQKDSVVDLTKEDIEEVREFSENRLNPYSVLSVGFSELIAEWDDQEYN